MTINSISNNQHLVPLANMQNKNNEEAIEIRTGTTEEAANTGKMTKAAEHQRGIGNKIDVVA